MATVFFKTTPIQDKEIKRMMADEGYTSKAEFFRFLLKFYKYEKIRLSPEVQKEADELSALVTKLSREGKLEKYGSLKEQLGDV